MRCWLSAWVSGLASLLLLAPAVPARSQEACDWPMFGHDAGRSFAASCSELSADSIPVPRWYSPADDSVTASPAVVEGVAYVGSWDGAFRAYDTASGEVLWTFDVPDAQDTAFGRIVSSAWVGELSGTDVVLFGGGATLYALDPASGALVASVDTDPRPGSPDDGQAEIESSPVVMDGHVYVGHDVHNAAGAGPTGLLSFSFGPSGFSLDWKFDPETGQVLDSLQGEGGHGCGGVWGSPAVDEDSVFFGTSNCADDSASEGLFAVDRATGALRWSFHPRGANTLDDDFGATPNLLPGDRVGIGGKDGWYYAFDRTTGAEAWRTHLGQSGHAYEQFAVGGIIGSTAVGDGRIYATTALSTPFDPVAPAPDATLFDDPARMLSLHALDAATGALLWRTPLSRQSYGPPSFANGVVVVPSTFSATLGAFDASDGEPLWILPLPGPPASTPVLAGDGLYLGIGVRETDAEFKAFGDELSDGIGALLGAHPLSRLSGLLVLDVAG